MALSLKADEVHVWSAAGKAALPHVLSRYLDRPSEQIELRREVHGKPQLAGRSPAIRFNLSHSGGLTLVAVAARLEVGVDVEAVARGRDFERLAERWLGDEVAETVRESAAEIRGAAFYAAWVRREAIAKCHGTGLGAPPPPQPVSVVELDVGDGHAAALAVAGSIRPSVRQRTLPGRG